jgi:hypothetical protein
MRRRKLTERAAQEILNLRREGMKTRELAKKFGVTGGTISHIITGRTWRHLDRTGIESRAPFTAEKESEPAPPSTPAPEPVPEPEPELPPPPPPPPPKPVRDPNKKYCEKCDRVMKIENTSHARYTVFVLWRCVCGYQTLEKKHPGECVGNAKTPKHGHVKYWYAKGRWRWLSACSGSGKPAIWVQTVGERT